MAEPLITRQRSTILPFILVNIFRNTSTEHRGGWSISNHPEHEYLRDTLISTYKECISCNMRTQFTCVMCGYCYSCHWKKEELERAESAPIVQNISQSTAIAIEQPSVGQLAMDVYGQQIEPICNYRTCSHKFSEHDNLKCKCRHAFNYATGVSISQLAMIKVL